MDIGLVLGAVGVILAVVFWLLRPEPLRQWLRRHLGRDESFSGAETQSKSTIVDGANYEERPLNEPHNSPPHPSTNHVVPPTVTAWEGPELHRLDEYKFQGLCRDLFCEEPGIATCEVYGTRGQKQDGVDLRAQRVDRTGIELGQCRCYKSFPPAEIRKASKDFFDHYDRWAPENVKRFIVFVGCDLSRKEQQDEVAKQAERFAKCGIDYEVWSNSMIRNKLRRRPGIVREYLGERWAEEICGLRTVAPHQQDEGVRLASVLDVEEQLSAVVKRLSGAIATELEKTRQDYREGNKRGALEWIQSIKDDEFRWGALDCETKAAILRLNAFLVLDLDADLEIAERLADQADELASAKDDVRLRALLEYRKSGLDNALSILEGRSHHESLNLKAALLLASGKKEDARNVLVALLSKGENAETLRLSAVLKLVDRDLPGARRDIKKCLELEPRWATSRFVAGTIGYYEALAGGCIPDQLPIWPEPVDWQLVKRDDVSLAGLGHAADLFLKLASETHGRREDERVLETWRLACIACDFERQNEAAAYCGELLEKEPDHFRVIAWCVARHLPVDLGNSERVIAAKIKIGDADLEHTIALASCYLAAGRSEEAAKLIMDQKPEFEKRNAADLWVFWASQCLALSGKSESALSMLDNMTSAISNRARTVALSAQASETGNWQPLAQHLKRAWEESRDQEALLAYCDVMAREKRWGDVADLASDLVFVGTSESHRLAVVCSFNAKRYPECLSIIDKHRDLYRHGRFPTQIRQIRMQCLRAMGALSDAIADAQDLTKDEPSPTSILSLAQLYFYKGELRSIAGLAEMMLSFKDSTAEELFQLACLCQFESRGDSVRLWNAAVDRSLPDKAIPSAVALGYALGQDEHMGPLLRRLSELGQAEKAGVMAVSYEKLSEVITAQSERVVRGWELYMKGEIPIHALSDEFRLPLVTEFYQQLTANQSKPDSANQPALFTTHGGREPTAEFITGISSGRLHVDVTAILLAKQIGILELVEKAFAPLHIPADLIPCLTEMRGRVRDAQPSRSESGNLITRLVEDGEIQIVDMVLPARTPGAEARGMTSLLQRFLKGVRDIGKLLVVASVPGDLPEDLAPFAVNCRSLVEALLQHGELTTHDHSRAVSALGKEATAEIRADLPDPGRELVCMMGAAELLADAGVLERIARMYEVAIQRGEYQSLRMTQRMLTERDKTDRWLEELIDRISHGVNAGTYRVLPDPGASESELTDNGPALSTLTTLLRCTGDEDQVVWVDDRRVNAHARNRTSRIVGIVEVLQALRNSGSLHDGEFYSLLMKLRRANCRFIGISSEEILYHLGESRVDNGLVVETEVLRVLRQYVAACMMQPETAQRPGGADRWGNPMGELRFFLDVRRAVATTLFEIWASPKDVSTKRAFCDWVLSSLHLDHRGDVLSDASSTSKDKDRYEIALSLAELILAALDTKNKSGTDQQEYLGWLSERVLRMRFDSDPLMVSALADLLKRHIGGAVEYVLTQQDSPAIYLVIQRFFDNFPELLQEELALDSDFMTRIGLQVVERIEIAGLVFEAKEYGRAVLEAVNGRTAEITPEGKSKPITLKPIQADKGPPGFSFLHPDRNEEGVLRGEEFSWLSESQQQIDEAKKRLPAWIDCSIDATDDIARQLMSEPSPHARLVASRTWRSSNMLAVYRDIAKEVKETHRFDRGHLLPIKADGLRRYLRLGTDVGSGVEFSDACDVAAKTLAEQRGLAETIERFWALPIVMPKSLMDLVRALAPDEQRTLIKRLVRRSTTPLSQVHVSRIVAALSGDSRVFRRLAKRLITSWASEPMIDDTAALLAVIGAVADAFGKFHEIARWPRQLKLACIWVHGHNLFAILRAFGVPSEWIRETFPRMTQIAPHEVFHRDWAYWTDVSHPRSNDAYRLMLSGLVYCLMPLKHEPWIKECVHGFLGKAAFIDVDGKPLPRPEMFRLSSLAADHLNSFLTGDLGANISELLGGAKVYFSWDTLESEALKCLTAIDEGRDIEGHIARLYATVGEYEPSPTLLDPLGNTLAKTDFVSIFELDKKVGGFAILLASHHVRYAKDEQFKSRFTEALVKVAKYLGELPEAQKRDVSMLYPADREDLLILEAAFNLAIAGQPSDAANQYCEIILRVSDVWPGVRQACRKATESLYRQLPPPDAAVLWRLLCRLRCS